MILRIGDLRVRYGQPCGTRREVLAGVNLELSAGEAVGIRGASGCGKTTLARAIACLLPRDCLISGTVEFQGADLLRLPESKLGSIRGARLTSISQEPSTSLTPHLRIRPQIAEVLRRHRGLDWNAAMTEAYSAIGDFFPDGKNRVGRSYPHELSSGERQRAAVSRALCCQPDLLIADEPTATLDSITQREVLDLLRDLRRNTGLTLIVISHDRRVLDRFATRTCVLRQGVLEAA